MSTISFWISLGEAVSCLPYKGRNYTPFQFNTNPRHCSPLTHPQLSTAHSQDVPWPFHSNAEVLVWQPTSVFLEPMPWTAGGSVLGSRRDTSHGAVEIIGAGWEPLAGDATKTTSHPSTAARCQVGRKPTKKALIEFRKIQMGKKLGTERLMVCTVCCTSGIPVGQTCARTHQNSGQRRRRFTAKI